MASLARLLCFTLLSAIATYVEGQDISPVGTTLDPEVAAKIANSLPSMNNLYVALIATGSFLVLAVTVILINHFRFESPFKHWERDSELEDYLAHFMSPPRTMDSPILSRSYIMEFSQKFDPDPRSRSGVDNPGFVERPDVRTVRPALETEV
uniref:Uncharacterized protein n=1 Tax=Branchiostoma floridae TaxID=7739 RepID=C3ZI33_BRAFL|eukprot:XP_002591764.1 hypothetical protein BRAFLDRAFT_83538 [Branchiostoma floridae]